MDIGRQKICFFYFPLSIVHYPLPEVFHAEVDD